MRRGRRAWSYDHRRASGGHRRAPPLRRAASPESRGTPMTRPLPARRLRVRRRTAARDDHLRLVEAATTGWKTVAPNIQHTPGGGYRVRQRVGKKRITLGVFATFVEALAAQTGVTEGGAASPARPTVETWMPTWFDRREKSDVRSVDSERNRAKKHVYGTNSPASPSTRSAAPTFSRGSGSWKPSTSTTRDSESGGRGGRRRRTGRTGRRRSAEREGQHRRRRRRSVVSPAFIGRMVVINAELTKQLAHLRRKRPSGRRTDRRSRLRQVSGPHAHRATMRTLGELRRHDRAADALETKDTEQRYEEKSSECSGRVWARHGRELGRDSCSLQVCLAASGAACFQAAESESLV